MLTYIDNWTFRSKFGEFYTKIALTFIQANSFENTVRKTSSILLLFIYNFITSMD